jgi:hypothetical protein
VAYPIRVRPQVEGEIVEAMAWYELRSPGLGAMFYRTYVGVLSILAESPELYRKVLRRVLVVSYTWRGDRLRIISVRKATPSDRAQYESSP